MSEQSVVVAKYSVPLEAEMAKGLLASEGITAEVSGDVSSAVWNFGPAGALIQLLVSASDAERAAALLQEHKQRLRSSDDWQEEAEEDVWVCAVCGTAVDNDLQQCTACQTPKEAVVTNPGRQMLLRRAIPEGEKGRPEQITSEPAPPVHDVPEPDHEIEPPDLSLLYADNLAWRAFLGAIAPLIILPFMYCSPLFMLVCLPFVGYSIWCLARLGFFSTAELSKRSWVYLLIALAVHCFYHFMVFVSVRGLIGL